MNEQEWLASKDPQKMLQLLMRSSVVTASDLPNYIINDRKLRLFACACARLGGYTHSEMDRDAVVYAEAWADGGHPVEDRRQGFHAGANWCILDSAIQAAMRWAEPRRGSPSLQQRADLLRCVVGNPFRPVTLPLRPVWSNVHGAGATCPWITPQVVFLAQAAYEERPGRTCKKCNGFGKKWDDRGGDGWFDCPNCRGTGTVEDGHLDPVRLSILADALEEAGCPQTDSCSNPNHRFLDQYGPNWGTIGACSLCGGTKKVLHPMLAHLRNPGPHFRGCWAVDLILGKE